MHQQGFSVGVAGNDKAPGDALGASTRGFSGGRTRIRTWDLCRVKAAL
jgi:hypothetical protein